MEEMEEELQPSTVLWKGHNEELMLDMTVVMAHTDERLVYTIVSLTIPDTGEREALINAHWPKDTMQSAIEDGSYMTMINNSYINSQVAIHKDYLEQKRYDN